MIPTKEEAEAIVRYSRMRIMWLKANVKMYRRSLRNQSKRKKDYEALLKVAPYTSQLDELSKELFNSTTTQVCRELVLAERAKKEIRNAIKEIRKYQEAIKKWS